MADITEAQVFEAFDLEGVTEQEVADPAMNTTTPDDGAKGQEVAAPDNADNPQEEPEEDAGPDNQEESADKEKVDSQSMEVRRQNAARRRQQEEAQRQVQIRQAVENARIEERQIFDSKMKDFFSKAGLKNTVTGEPITNMEEFESWNKQFNEAKLQRELKSGKLTTDGLAAAIGMHPAVQQAQKLVELEGKRKQEQEREQAQEKIRQEIQEINKLDKSINSLEDLANAPYWPQLYEMTKRGYSIKDAHFLLNYERLEQARIEAAKQQQDAKNRGKEHMVSTVASRGSGMATVPAGDMAYFRALMPEASDAEILAFYNRNRKS